MSVVRRFAGLWSSQYWDAEKIRAYQTRQVLEVLRHAVLNVPFYRGLGIDAASLRSAADLERFPLLTKQEVQARASDFISDGLQASDLHSSRSSGSTGEPLTTYFDRDSWLINKYALKLRRTAAAGLGAVARLLIVDDEPTAGAGLAWLGHLPRGPAYKRISVYDDIESASATLRAFRPTAVYAFPSWFTEIVRHAEHQGRPLPPIAAAFTSSEVLTATARRRIERAFGAAVFDIYGSTEFKEVAWQCRHGRYHVNFESTWIETCADDDAAEPSLLVLTTLNNRAMPLIRYSIQDRARVGHGSCACGRHSQYLEQIDGRRIEVLLLADGRRLSPYTLDAAIDSIPGIAKFQLVQPRKGCLSVQYVAKPGSSDEPLERELAARLRAAVGEIDLDFKRCDTLPRGPAGKHRMLIQPAARVTGGDTNRRA